MVVDLIIISKSSIQVALGEKVSHTNQVKEFC